jgi:hypothetical protein
MATKFEDDEYIAEHGAHSWEVDALPPNVLTKIIRGHIEGLLDRDLMDAVIAEEDADKEGLRKAVASIMKRKGAD